MQVRNDNNKRRQGPPRGAGPTRASANSSWGDSEPQYVAYTGFNHGAADGFTQGGAGQDGRTTYYAGAEAGSMGGATGDSDASEAAITSLRGEVGELREDIKRLHELLIAMGDRLPPKQ